MPERKIGFTAARRLSTFPVGYIEDVLDALPPADQYTTGGAIGGDALIGLWLATHRPQARHLVLLPSNHSMISEWWMDYAGVDPGRVEVHQMPPGSSYKYRNGAIVRASTELVGFPAFEEDHPRSRRSGTWQTLRIARALGIPVTVYSADVVKAGLGREGY